MKLAVKNWSKFQHYKTRRPPWIKLHRTLLDDKDWHSLPDASKALAVSLWLLASESEDGFFEGDSDLLAFRLRSDSKKIADSMKPLIDHGFIVLLADCYQVASKSCPETETETEAEAEIPSHVEKFSTLEGRGADFSVDADGVVIETTGEDNDGF